MSFSGVGSTASTRPDRPLIVKATFDRYNKRITFSSARNCSYDLLRSKVEQSFSLQAFSFSIAYKDDDGEVTDITSETDLTEAIQYFQAGVDDPPASSAQSILSGRSFGSRRITLRVTISVDYDGPSLSDTSSLVSLDDYKNGRGSESQFSLSFSGASQVEVEDDSVTISSRDTGISQHRQPQAVVTKHDFESLSGFGSHSDASSFDARYPEDPSAVLERLKLSDSSDSIERNTQWLRDQSSRTIIGAPGPASSDGDRSSIHLSEDFDHTNPFETPFDGDLALQQDNGKYYYTYTSASSSSSAASAAARDDASINSSNTDFDDSGYMTQKAKHSVRTQQDERTQSPRSRPTSQSAASLASSSRPSMFSSSSEPSPRSATSSGFPANIYDALQISQSPVQCTDCSSCGVILDTMRYVCSTCGEKPPRVPSRSNSESTFVNGKGKEREGSISYPPNSHRKRPLPSLPSRTVPGEPSSLNSSTATLTNNAGFELCPSCIETTGVVHALTDESTPSSPQDSYQRSQHGQQLTLSQLRRTAPRQKGHFRHAYIEKMWSPESGGGSWREVEQNDCSECTICQTQLGVGAGRRYKCASCAKFVLCRACYSQVHEIHPLHAFLDVPEVVERPISVRPGGARSEADLEGTSLIGDDGNEEESLTHPDVKCSHCLMDIVGARFHYAICENVDICSNCEAAGLPGNIDSIDDGHSSSHIMIKIPIPLNSKKVQTASRRARQLWTGRDGPIAKRNSILSQMAGDERDEDATTVIGERNAGRRGAANGTKRKTLDHHVLCKGCNQSIVGVRYQCATCPSTPDHVCNLCSNCEPKSYLLHNPNHIFFKLPRPVDRPLEAPHPFLPVLYKHPAGPRPNAVNYNYPKAYLSLLHHTAALCDHCMDRISGEWFRCAYCAKDLCDSCEGLNAHDRTHFFYVFKAPVDMQVFRVVAELDNPNGSPPVVKHPVYLS